MAAYPNLFSPIKIRGTELRNRIIMPGMGTLFMKDTFVNDQLIDYHVARAKGGTGLNVVEVSNVHIPSSPPRYGSLADDKYIPGYKKLTDAVHKAGGKASVFLWHPGIVSANFPGVQLVVPSDMPYGDQMLQGAGKDLLEEIIQCYGQAARRAVEAGMDCLEIHGAHNYLLHSFMTPAMNRREDEYGGSLENRARLAVEVIREVRRNMPGDMPLFMRVDAHDDYLENGLTVEDMIEMCKLFGQAGVDVIDVSRGNTLTNALKYEVPSLDIPYAFNVDNAAQIRKGTGMLIMAVGRINGAQLGEDILKNGKADLVGMGRVQITDPEFCNKAREGRTAEILRCMGCNQGCFDAHMDYTMPHITCVRNPAVGKEREYELRAATEPKTVLIAGGGLAGMEAATVLAQRGHKAILCEASDKLGGQFLTAGQAPRKGEMKAAAKHKGILAKMAGAAIRLNTPVTPALLEEIKPDVVINAVGAYASPPCFAGDDGKNIYAAADILNGIATPEGKVAIIGGGVVGLETAEYLAEKGFAVALIEQKEDVGTELGAIRKICVMENIAGLPVELLTETTATAITAQGVTAQKGGEVTTVPADSVVIAVGVASNGFAEEERWCKNAGVPLYTIGDGVAPRRALEAIAEAAKLAREI